jgi:hypothetical protein
MKEGKISPEDLDLLLVTDSPEEAACHVADRYQKHLARVQARFQDGPGAR